MPRWKKLGQIFVPDNNYPWMQSHAANPVARNIGENIFRIYFSCRDKQNRSSIASLDIDINSPTEVLSICTKPLLSPGEIGAFDDSGVSIGCIIDYGSEVYLYYMGWNLGVTVPWRNSIGMAIEQTDGSFKRYSPAPVLDRNHCDPYTISYPFILRENGLWRMWYGSNLKWGAEHQDMNHVIKYAESSDGINWAPSGNVAININAEGEYAFARPCVIKDKGTYHMWYSFRGESYKIGYATSNDGYEWKRKDYDAGISQSKEGWDSKSISYPFVFNDNNETFMLYSGNYYGKEGFGIAKLIKD